MTRTELFTRDVLWEIVSQLECLSTEELDQLMEMIKQGKPELAANMDLPDYGWDYSKWRAAQEVQSE